MIPSGGDGVYIHECSGCQFTDLVLTDNYRQACSVIAARDTLFENCEFINTGMTGGTAPQAGQLTRNPPVARDLRAYF